MQRTVSGSPSQHRRRHSRNGILVKNFGVNDFLTEYRLLEGGDSARILNAGSASVRYGDRCVNVDIQPKPNVDVVADIQSLPSELADFDAVICSAVLQYCIDPAAAAREFYRVMKPGGLLFIDAPWIQPYCVDTPDRYRFSADALRTLFAQFEVLETGPSIRPGAALAHLGVEIARSLTGNRYINYLAAKLVGVMLLPACYIRTRRESNLAGANYLIGRKPLD